VLLKTLPALLRVYAVVPIHAKVRSVSHSQLDVFQLQELVMLGMFAVVEVRVAEGRANRFVSLLVIFVLEVTLAALLARVAREELVSYRYVLQVDRCVMLEILVVEVGLVHIRPVRR
jgi:hypothetical protein